MTTTQNKPPRPRPPRPVESFGPEILASLLKGALEGLELSMPYKMAIRYRMRIHQLREAMRKANHEKYPHVAKVRVEIKYPPTCLTEYQGRHVVPVDRSTVCRVTLKPNDSEFGDMLRIAGVDLDLNDDLDLAEAEPDHSPNVLEQMLKEL